MTLSKLLLLQNDNSMIEVLLVFNQIQYLLIVYMETIKDPISTLLFFYKEETTRMNNNNPGQPQFGFARLPQVHVSFFI